MKKLLFPLLLLCSIQLYAQDCRVCDDEEMIREHKIKSVWVQFHPEDSEPVDMIRREWDEDAKPSYTYFMYYFEPFPHTKTYTYSYNSSSQLTAMFEREGFPYMKTAEDSAILNISSVPKITKYAYEYDRKGREIKRSTFFDMRDEQPNVINEYAYDRKGNKVSSKFSNPKFSARAQAPISYLYNKESLLIEEKQEPAQAGRMFMGGYIKRFQYDEEDRLQETIYTNLLSQTETKTKYVYKNGNLVEKIRYTGDGEFRVSEFEYSSDGKLMKKIEPLGVKGSRTTVYEYNEKGFLQAEHYLDEEGKHSMTFITTYEYYP